MTAIVELKNVTKAVSNGMNEEKVILDDVSLEIREHDFITILEKYLHILRNSPFFKGLTDNEILKLQKEGFIKTNRNHFELIFSNDADSRIRI